MDRKGLALHLIKEDLKYHRMVAQCAAVELHIEFFPDMASVVKVLLGQEETGDDWEDKYVVAMGKAEELASDNPSEMEAVALEILEMLNDEF